MWLRPKSFDKFDEMKVFRINEVERRENQLLNVILLYFELSLIFVLI